jgi:hypothetical protein
LKAENTTRPHGEAGWPYPCSFYLAQRQNKTTKQ